MRKSLNKFREILDTPETEAKINSYVSRLISSRERLADRIKRFHVIYHDKLDSVIERLTKKYNSKAYIKREMKLGYEPRETLLWFIFEYAKIYGQPCEDEAYLNEFTGEAYYLGSYVIQVMYGQGSVLRIDKHKGIKKLKEYYIIEEFYGKQTAKRSRVPLINHINEGLRILDMIGASQLAKKAYCLHPIFQSDEALLANHDKYQVEPSVLLRVMEYRSVANEYLSIRQVSHIDDIRLSPLKDVNDMLFADKVQNFKDFEIYHEATHARSKELKGYFLNWLARLGITQEKFIEIKSSL